MTLSVLGMSVLPSLLGLDSVLGMVLRSPGPFIFRIPEDWPLVGGNGLRWYGLLMAGAVLVGLFLAKGLAERQRLEKEPGQASERIELLALGLVISGFLGARLYYVATHWADFVGRPLAALAIWEGGIIIHGGILAGGLALYVYSRLTGINGWRYADILTAPLILGQAIGRWGNFFNREAYGAPIVPESGWPIRELIPPEARLPQYRDLELYHPIFLYESLLNLVLFGILMTMFVRYPKLKPGTWVWTYVVGYSLIRIPYEMLRISAVAYIGDTGIKAAYVASGVGLVLGISMLVYMYRFRWDPDLEQAALWLGQTAQLDPAVADTMVQRSWNLLKCNPKTDRSDQISLAMPYFPSSWAQRISVSRREAILGALFAMLEGQHPPDLAQEPLSLPPGDRIGPELDVAQPDGDPE